MPIRFETFEPRRMLDAAELFFELDTSYSNPGNDHAWLGDELIFVAADEHGDIELWKSDGTASGTARVKDIRVGNQGSIPQALVATQDRVYFTAYEESSGRELWSTDGTEEGTRRVADLIPGPGDGGLSDRNGYPSFNGSGIRESVAVNGKVYFSMDGGLLVSDGTDAGTQVIPGVSARELVNFGGQLLFVGSDFQHGSELWTSDGTKDGTELSIELFPGPPHHAPNELTVVGDKLFFSGYTNRGVRGLWISDGTIAGTMPIAYGHDPSNLVATDNLLFYQTEIGGVWRSDGTVDGTFEVHTGIPRDAIAFAPAGDKVYFAAQNSLWQSDGSVEGTTQITTEFNTIRHLQASNGRAFFQATDETAGSELWTTNGTEVGRIDVLPGPGSSAAAAMTSRGGNAFFWTTQTPGLWFSDGAQEGTIQLQDSIHGASPGSTTLRNLTELNGGFFFEVQHSFPRSDQDLWYSNGTPEGTAPVEVTDASRSSLVRLGDRVFFVAAKDGTSAALWRTDGTAAGTGPVFTSEANLRNLTASGDNLFFTAINDENRHMLWVSDGTTEGTRMLRSDLTEIAGTREPELVDVNGTLFFLIRNDPFELWTSDGTESGTQFIAELDVPSRDGGVQLQAGENQASVIYNFGRGRQRVGKVWMSDGTADGTILLLEGPGNSLPLLSVDPGNSLRGQTLGNQFIFPFDDGNSGTELWVTDGTAVGTQLLKNIVPGAEGAYPGDLEVADGKLFFSATTADGDRELWVSDGTTEGTLPVGPLPGGFSLMAASSNGVLYFTADDEAGNELWQSDGTQQGTMRVTDIAPGSASSGIKYATEINGYVYFHADDGFHGRELWRIPVASLPGDADDNGTVDFADFLTLSDNFNRADDVAFADGDFDKNGRVDFEDFLILSANFGRSRTS